VETELYFDGLLDGTGYGEGTSSNGAVLSGRDEY